MSEEKTEEIVETDSTNSKKGEVASDSEADRKPVYIALAVIGTIVLAAGIYWFWPFSEGGKPVPAPRTVSFGQDTNQQTSGTTGEQTLMLQPGQAEAIGLKIEAVGETLSSEAMSVAATGVVQPDAYKETPVISLVGGVARKVNVELGQNVVKGQTIAIVFSDERAAAQSRYLALQTKAQTARQNYDRTARLVKISPASNAELDQALTKLKTAQAELEEHHKHHERTMRLVEIGAESRESMEMATTKLKTAEADVEEAQKRYDRAVKVAEIDPVSRGEFEQAAVNLQTSESDLAMSKQRLLLLGLSAQRVNALHSPSQISSELNITAPVSGTITARSVNQGEVIEANKELMKVTNLSNVWVIAQVYEKDLGRLRIGSGAGVTTDSYPGGLFRGHVTYIDPNINQETRTAQVRVELDNPGQILKIGMYTNVAFGLMGVAEKTMPMVPSSAVQNMNERQVVFLATDDPNTYIVRSVRLGTESNGKSIVLEGLHVGDRVVTDRSFLLRAELLKQNPNSQ
ncbi:MAG TPA: efflux RND transporter periplasmic adaptor subunit [Pyrinomonadaceae bacterium]|jgi:RND family efflux transporter MFP subunit|nr:efflux RND transporter periplasmic adaptor subunit [Pyrinomonadaceae bacterium]